MLSPFGGWRSYLGSAIFFLLEDFVDLVDFRDTVLYSTSKASLSDHLEVFSSLVTMSQRQVKSGQVLESHKDLVFT
jgi:hypothetical protein